MSPEAADQFLLELNGDRGAMEDKPRIAQADMRVSRVVHDLREHVPQGRPSTAIEQTAFFDLGNHLAALPPTKLFFSLQNCWICII